MTRRKSLKMKQQKNNQQGEDIISFMPDDILLYIMSFIKIQEAIRTCILSKRWKNLWKFLPNLKLHSVDFHKNLVFFEFVSKIVFLRNYNISLHTLEFVRHNYFKHEIMTNLMHYVVGHNIQQLRVVVPFNVGLPPCVFSCESLTHLSISCSRYNIRTKIPMSLNLPNLLSLHFDNVPILAYEDGQAKPFSSCRKLNTLSFDNCSVLYPNAFISDGSEILIIDNATLANLTMDYTLRYKTVICAPNLSSFTISGAPFPTLHEQKETLHGQKKMNVEIRSASLVKISPSRSISSGDSVEENVGLKKKERKRICENDDKGKEFEDEARKEQPRRERHN
ncbi:hypothetical protein Fmac_016421 [Flemingia macrophylla]|uniref:F-box domain-containing protein n=1 Tax=Flemingia macrophylla TaxID=520843 RepID=A0ABD1MI71_9FABA